jgi:hypothetical protein
MAFNPALPADHSPLSSAEMRSQLNALNDQLAALQSQLAPLVPVLNRDAGGNWTLVFAGPVQDMWLIWARCNGSEAWSNTGELPTSAFTAADGDVAPDGATWWQVKICGEGLGDGLQHTAFSNIISFGPVPDA